METILVVEDDTDIRELERYTLSTAGYTVLEAEHGKQALEHLQSQHVDLIVLDIMMPVMDGLTTIKTIRYGMNNSVPVIVVSARGEESDIITALELGADDYVSKPFSAKVLASKIKAVMRRTQEADHHTIVQNDGLTMDQQKHQCMLDGQEIELTATEFALLYLLVSNKEQVFTRNQLITKVKGDDYPVTDRSIDVQIATLRKKLGQYGSRIKTIWGIGYTYKDQ